MLADFDFPSINLHADNIAEKSAALQTREQEWLLKRRGKFTASEFSRLMTYEAKGAFLPDGAKTYAEEKAIELLTIPDVDNDVRFMNDAMQWGKDTEVEAVEMFMLTHGLTVEKYGDRQEFIELGEIGCTPDGLIGENSGIETKCPNSKTHAGYLALKNVDDFKKACANYYWQVMGTMAITGRENWYFVSYDPRFKDDGLRLKVLLIERNEADIEHLLKRLDYAIEHRDDFVDSIKPN